jgi:RNA polymerase sigma-70 factor, ECF subfamily
VPQQTDKIVATFLSGFSSAELSGISDLKRFVNAVGSLLQAGFEARAVEYSDAIATAVLGVLMSKESLATCNMEQLDSNHVADLVLAQACAIGDAAAIALFVSEFGDAMTSDLMRMRFDQATAADLRQEVLTRLMSGLTPKIATYSGRARLRTWLRAVVTREGLGILRKRNAVPTDDQLQQQLSSDVDSDAGIIQSRYSAEFKSAFTEAMASLDADDRLLLRSYYVDGLTVDEIGKLYALHKSTISRRVGLAREKLGSRLHRAFCARVGTSESEVRSIARGLENHLELSLSRLTRLA